MEPRLRQRSTRSHMAMRRLLPTRQSRRKDHRRHQRIRSMVQQLGTSNMIDEGNVGVDYSRHWIRWRYASGLVALIALWYADDDYFTVPVQLGVSITNGHEDVYLTNWEPRIPHQLGTRIHMLEYRGFAFQEHDLSEETPTAIIFLWLPSWSSTKERCPWINGDRAGEPLRLRNWEPAW